MMKKLLAKSKFVVYLFVVQKLIIFVVYKLIILFPYFMIHQKIQTMDEIPHSINNI